MRCSTCRKLRIVQESGLLSPRRQTAMLRHLERCPRCQETSRQDQRLRGLLGAAPTAGARRDLWPAVAVRIAARQSRRVSLGRRAWRPALALATLVVAVGFALTLFSRLQPAPGAEDLGPGLVPTNARVISEDPWAGDVARALDAALSQGT